MPAGHPLDRQRGWRVPSAGHKGSILPVCFGLRMLGPRAGAGLFFLCLLKIRLRMSNTSADSSLTGLNHFNAQGQAHMVDISDKAITARLAKAHGTIALSGASFAAVMQGTSKKGDILGIARIAAIQATKATSTLIPLCHPIGLSHVDVHFQLDEAAQSVRIEVTTRTVSSTGVEMEALTGAMAGLLTIYDMLKAVDKKMVIGGVEVIRKTGGKTEIGAGD